MFPHVRAYGFSKSGEPLTKCNHLVKLVLLVSLDPFGMVNVLFTSTGIRTDGLDVILRIRTDNNFFPSGRNDKSLDTIGGGLRNRPSFFVNKSKTTTFSYPTQDSGPALAIMNHG